MRAGLALLLVAAACAAVASAGAVSVGPFRTKSITFAIIGGEGCLRFCMRRPDGTGEAVPAVGAAGDRPRHLDLARGILICLV